ncbi:hypothetical protein [Tenggerimyces flavus]|uniref:Uncharacterized protein n=1 Tax=Tenggerimyces flavus TaxID=1708749 RepID=A0ABV7YQW6_9ACTN|nr:hypothetical protein [Tenggerimyces flavus]MBM7786360.1 hypothetical protein [Tenggerimyces flavus]
MSELRDPASDRPDDRPPDARAPIDAGRTKEVDAVADAKSFDPATPTYDPRDHLEPRESRAEPAAQLPDRPTLVALGAKIRAESKDRFEPSDAEKLAAEVDRPAPAAEHRDPEQLHRFGNKSRAGPVRDRDLGIDSWDKLVGPYAPTSPADIVPGASTFIDPRHPDVGMNGPYHRLPVDFQPPEGSGLAIHRDGKDVSPDAPHKWGHRTIYATEAMTAAEFSERVAALPWEYADSIPRGRRGNDGNR